MNNLSILNTISVANILKILPLLILGKNILWKKVHFYRVNKKDQIILWLPQSCDRATMKLSGGEVFYNLEWRESIFKQTYNVDHKKEEQLIFIGLPGTNPPGIEMNKIWFWVVAYAATLHGTGCILEFSSRHIGQSYIDCPTFQMQALFGYTAACSSKFRICGRWAVPWYNFEYTSTASVPLQTAQHIK